MIPGKRTFFARWCEKYGHSYLAQHPCRAAWLALRGLLGIRGYWRAYFEFLYGWKPDPWNYGSSGYEAEKYRRILSVLQKPVYSRALEAGCSVGVLTGLLMKHACFLDAIDISWFAVRRARQRLQGSRCVRLIRSDLLRYEPGNVRYDLVVCSEILYYLWFPVSLRQAVRKKLISLVKPGGELVVVYGGIHMWQDWKEVFSEAGLLLLRQDLYCADPFRDYRILVFEKMPDGARSHTDCLSKEQGFGKRH